MKIGHSPLGQWVQTFTVPGASGGYAPERIRIGDVPSGQVRPLIRSITAAVSATVADADVELWLCEVDASAEYLNADYFDSALQIDAPGTATTWELALWPGAEIRVKSGGTGGNLTLHVVAMK